MAAALFPQLTAIPYCLANPTVAITPTLVLLCRAGMLLVYIVVAGDMLVGKPGFKGLLCDYLGDKPHCHWACNRKIVTGLVTLLVLLPLVSFRCGRPGPHFLDCYTVYTRSALGTSCTEVRHAVRSAMLSV